MTPKLALFLSLVAAAFGASAAVADVPAALPTVATPAAALPAAVTPVAAPAALSPARACRPGTPGVPLQSARVQWRISPCLGGIESVRLRDPQFLVPARPAPPGIARWAEPKFAAGQLELVETWDAKWDPFRDHFEELDAGPVQLGIRKDGVLQPAAETRLTAYQKIDPLWGVVAQSAGEVVLVWPDPQRVKSPIYLEKRFAVGGPDAPYTLHLELTVVNLGTATARYRLTHEVTTFQNPGEGGGGFLAMFAGPPDTKGAAFSVAGEATHFDAKSLADAEADKRTRVAVPEWLAIDSRYFLMASAPVGGFSPQSEVLISALPNGVVMARLRTAAETLPGAGAGCVPSWYARAWGGSACKADLDLLGLHTAENASLTAETLDRAAAAGRERGADIAAVQAAAQRLRARQQKTAGFDLYTGPKELDVLKPAGHNLETAIDFGWFGVIARPMLAVLKFAHGMSGSWPLAILILTVLVKALLWPITGKSMKSMRNMQKIKPELDKIRAELEAKAKKQGKDKADPQELNQATFALYKKHNVNPLGGCLPLMLQMPIYIALYRTINASVDLYNQPLFGWVTDLTQKDPYYVLPAVLGAVMFLQQKLTPQAGGDPMQQKMMLYFMPALFTLMMLQLPSGLTLYILTNTVLGIVQTMVYNRADTSAAKA